MELTWELGAFQNISYKIHKIMDTIKKTLLDAELCIFFFNLTMELFFLNAVVCFSYSFTWFLSFPVTSSFYELVTAIIVTIFSNDAIFLNADIEFRILVK